MAGTAESIASENWDAYFTDVLTPTIVGWLNNQVSPRSAEEATKDLAKSAVKKGFSRRPVKPPVVFENGYGKGLLWGGFISTFLGVGMIFSAPVWLGVVFVIAGIAFFVSARANWMTPEKCELLAEEEHQKTLRYWRDSRDRCVRDVVSQWNTRLHLTIARQVGVPKRLQNEFARMSRDREGLLKSEWEAEIESWCSQPEFPPAPGPIPEGISHEEYEQYCCLVLQSWGFLDAATTRFSRDGGVDVEADEIVVQCKHYKGNVGVREIREIFGIAAHKSKNAVVFCAGSYTTDARAFADEAGVALFVLSELHGTAKPLNDHARLIVQNTTRRI